MNSPVNERFKKPEQSKVKAEKLLKHIEIWRYTQYYCLYLYKDVEESSERFQKIRNITKGLFNPVMFY